MEILLCERVNDLRHSLGISIPSVICRFPLFIISMAHFSMIHSIPISSLHILATCIWISDSFSFLANCLMSSTYIRWLIFFLWFMKLVFACTFPKCVIEWRLSLFIIPFKFFTPVLADSFSLEFKWQQIFSCLQDNSQYSGRSQQCCSLNGFHSFSYFQVLQSLYQSLVDCSKSTNYNWSHRHIPVSRFSFNSLARSSYLSFFSLSFNFTLCYPGQQSPQFGKFSFLLLLIINRFGRLAETWWSVCISKSQNNLCVTFSRTDSGLSIYYLFVWSKLNFFIIHNGSPGPPSHV